MHAQTRVAAVVVTWNRRHLVVESISAVLAQTHPPARVIVVDNASTDGSAELVQDTFSDRVELVRSAVNTGGAGGFALGIERALLSDTDAIWVMDDDTVPEPGALAALVSARERYGGSPHPPVLVASRVVWTDGRNHPMNTPREKPGVSQAEREDATAVGCIPIRTASFVSILIDARRVRDVGLPTADMFLWNDDFEFTGRVIRGHRGLFCPDSVVVHKTKQFGGTTVDPGPRFFYEVRNKVWTFLRSDAFTLPERAVYGGSTVRRWGATFAASDDRPTLARNLVRGLAAGLKRGPLPTDHILARAWPPPTGTGPAEPFSVLLPFYAGDDPDAFELAFRSVTTQQQLRPDEVVLVQDGPVPEALSHRVAAVVAVSPVPVQQVHLVDNSGLGPALEAGLAACSFDIVARQDADDLSLPGRFAAQVPLVAAGADMVGSALLEFESDPEHTGVQRTPPLRPNAILRDARFAQPFFHPTMVYRRSLVAKAGGYQNIPLLEDYWLIARMILAGARVANVAEPLVKYRIGAGAYARRGGTDLLRAEWELQQRFLRSGFTTPKQFARNVAVRCTYRLIPESVRRTSYRALLAQRGGR